MSDLDEICRRVRISDYLEARGVKLAKAGNRLRCLCPLPDHKDTEPSFYVTERPDGVQWFKCFGCGVGGSLFKLVSEMEKCSMGSVIGRMARSCGVELDGRRSESFVPEPTPDEVTEAFCTEDREAHIMSAYALSLMNAHGASEDVVSKVSKVYEYLDRLVEMGDEEALYKASERLRRIMMEYD